MTRFVAITTLCLSMLTASGARAGATDYTYWPGFAGSVVSMIWPADRTRASDRYLTLVIRIAKDPKVRPVVYDSAFHAVCQRHRAELLRTARKLSADNDWRVWVRFVWPVGQTDGAGIAVFRQKMMFLSNCRPA